MAIDFEQLQREIDAIPIAIANNLEKELSEMFDSCGLYYRMFSRFKSSISTINKFKIKNYSNDGKKMQDILGVRVALYFKDDIDVCVKIIENNYDVVEITRDEPSREMFSPMRLNIVCKMDEDTYNSFSSELWTFPIDKTFEIQVRTIFSEGWHEVEHDLRYKNKADWAEHLELSRNLNGILATLETCDWAILNVFDNLAYQKYKSHEWNPMLRNHLRIHFFDNSLSLPIQEIFNNNTELAKEFLKFDRTMLLLFLSDHKQLHIPRKMDTIAYLINDLWVHNEMLLKTEPDLLKKQLLSYHGEN